MNAGKPILPSPRPLILIFILISVFVISIGFIFYLNQKNNILRDSLQELSTISDLKIKQINLWRQERLSDGLFLSNNSVITRQLYNFLSGNRDTALRKDLLMGLKSLNDSYEYRNILFLDSIMNVRLFYPASDTIIGDYLNPLLPQYYKKGDVVLTDLHSTGKVSFIHLDLIVPLRKPGSDSGKQFGLLVLRIDPQRVLWPMIQSWPVISKTSETLIFHREGDEVVYLNRLRHLENSELVLRRNISEKNLPEVMALDGIQETKEGIDYRGMKVIAVMKKVPDSPWYMVAKTDRKEVLKVLNSRALLIFVFTFLFIIASGLFLGIFWWNQQVRFYRSEYEAETERLALISHFDYILKYANDIILLLDKDLQIVEANDRALEAYQYSRSEIKGISIRNLLPEESELLLKENRKTIDQKGSGTFEIFHRRKDGTLFPVEVSTKKVVIEGVQYYHSICRDISERKLSEAILKESEVRFRKIFEENPVGLVMTDKDFSILKVNRSFCDMTGYPEAELIGLTFKDLTHPDHFEGDSLSMMKMTAGELPVYHTEKRYITKEQKVIWASTTVSIIRNKDGGIQFFLAMVEDITARKKAEEDLIKAKEKAEEGDRLKTAFLHNISHEIRTPMNAILGFTALLSEPVVSEEDRKQFIDIIFQSGSQLLSIINDIVDIASIESGQVKFNPEKVNINSLLRKLNEQFSYRQVPERITLTLLTGLPDDDSNIVTDNTKLIQIISNLISNAFKFTEKGKIRFGYERKDNDLEFFVQDSGIGISPEHHSRIFERFYQIDSTSSRKFTGTGLGLSICKAYTEILGGTIRVESAEGKGAKFCFTIPYDV